MMIRWFLTRALSVVLLSVGLIGVSAPAQAATCQWVQPGGPHTRYEYCSGVNSYYTGSQFTQGETSFYPDPVNDNPSIYLSGRLADIAADTFCTKIRFKSTNNQWPDGNTVSDPDWKVCGNGSSKVIGIMVDDAYTYSGSKIEFQHCRDSNVGWICKTFFTRTIP